MKAQVKIRQKNMWYGVIDQVHFCYQYRKVKYENDLFF